MFFFLYSFLHSSTALCFWLSTVTRFSHVIFSKSHKCQFPSEYSVLTNQSILLLLCFSSAPCLLSSHKAMSILSVAACLSIDVCYLNECESIFFYSLCSCCGICCSKGFIFQFSYFSTLSHTHSLSLYLSHSISFILSLSLFLFWKYRFSGFSNVQHTHPYIYIFFIPCTTFSYFLFIGDHNNLYFQNTHHDRNKNNKQKITSSSRYLL